MIVSRVIGHLGSFKLSNDEGLGTEMKLLLARAGKYLFKNENPFCDVMNSDTCMLNYVKTNAFRGFLLGREFNYKTSFLFLGILKMFVFLEEQKI